MEIREISFYEKFACLGGECPETCCRGWIIPLEDEDCDRFRAERGPLRRRLFLATQLFTTAAFNTSSRTCPFHNKEGLCAMQLQKGHDYLPEACRMYPRFFRNYGPFEEHYADLSCIKSARLFLDHADDLFLSVREGTPLIDCCVTNDDIAFLRSLDRSRTELIRHFQRAGTFEEFANLLSAASDYAKRMQESFLHGETDFLERHSFTDFLPQTGYEAAASAPSLFPFSAKLLRQLMGSTFYHSQLRKKNPTLFHLCGLYFKKHRHIADTQTAWERAVSSFMERYPETVPLYAAYYAYYLYLYYLKSYEDYSFLRNTRLGIIHLNMVFLFSVLYEREHGHFDKEELALIIAVYNRRAFFNGRILDDMYKFLPIC